MGSVQRGPSAAATLRRAAVSQSRAQQMSYALTSSLGKARIVVNAVPECSRDSERRAHGGEGG